MIEIISNGSKWYNEKKDDIKELKKILKIYMQTFKIKYSY